MKPVVLVTVCRRYRELAGTLGRVRDLAGEFSERPDVAVVWARPEVGRLWFFRKLSGDGLVDRVLTRPPAPGEGDGLATTAPESLNIRLGLEWARDNYDPASTYAVVLAADVVPNARHAFAFVDDHMSRGGGRAAVFHWPNGCVPTNVWHTNFFAVRLDDERYWPPVLQAGSSDTLEWAWGKRLMDARLPGVLESHNARNRRFSHAHLSEGLPEWPVVPESAGQSASLLISGRLPWWRRLAERLRLARPFARAGG